MPPKKESTFYRSTWLAPKKPCSCPALPKERDASHPLPRHRFRMIQGMPICRVELTSHAGGQQHPHLARSTRLGIRNPAKNPLRSVGLRTTSKPTGCSWDPGIEGTLGSKGLSSRRTYVTAVRRCPARWCRAPPPWRSSLSCDAAGGASTGLFGRSAPKGDSAFCRG